MLLRYHCTAASMWQLAIEMKEKLGLLEGDATKNILLKDH